MAAPVVTGAAALLLQGTPSLTTAHVKMALQSGATPIDDGGLMGAGAGSLNP
jgi:serine protease AprX